MPHGLTPLLSFGHRIEAVQFLYGVRASATCCFGVLGKRTGGGHGRRDLYRGSRDLFVAKLAVLLFVQACFVGVAVGCLCVISPIASIHTESANTHTAPPDG